MANILSCIPDRSSTTLSLSTKWTHSNHTSITDETSWQPEIVFTHTSDSCGSGFYYRWVFGWMDPSPSLSLSPFMALDTCIRHKGHLEPLLESYWRELERENREKEREEGGWGYFWPQPQRNKVTQMGRPQLERRVIDSRVGGLRERQREGKEKTNDWNSQKNLVPDPTFNAGFRVFDVCYHSPCCPLSNFDSNFCCVMDEKCIRLQDASWPI